MFFVVRCDTAARAVGSPVAADGGNVRKVRRKVPWRNLREKRDRETFPCVSSLRGLWESLACRGVLRRRAEMVARSAAGPFEPATDHSGEGNQQAKPLRGLRAFSRMTVLGGSPYVS